MWPATIPLTISSIEHALIDLLPLESGKRRQHGEEQRGDGAGLNRLAAHVEKDKSFTLRSVKRSIIVSASREERNIRSSLAAMTVSSG